MQEARNDAASDENSRPDWSVCRGYAKIQSAIIGRCLGRLIEPVIMSDAGCAAIHPHPRNKTDDQLRALADKGGVLGIYDLPYLAGVTEAAHHR
jgi:hypothetical protein